MRLQLIRVHEDGTSARWKAAPNDLRIVLVIPARPYRPPPGAAM